MKHFDERIHRSRYERRQHGFTLEKIAEQDGVTDGAVWQSIRGYAHRAGLPMPTPATVTGSQLAKALGVSDDKVRRWKVKGILPSEAHGKAVRFSVDDVRQALERRANERAPSPTERTCCECNRTLPLDAFITITVKDKRCRPGHTWTGPSYDCRECRNQDKRDARAQQEGFPTWEAWQTAWKDALDEGAELSSSRNPSLIECVEIPSLTAADVERFHAKHKLVGECWEWNGSRNASGYGKFFVYRDGRRIRLVASRVAWTVANGPIPHGKFVLHTCDNPPCVNPAHLFVGTALANTHDMIIKRRHAAARSAR